jgi:hypothetical protein
MRVRIVVALLFVFVFAYGARALAQHQNPLVGSWERFSASITASATFGHSA